MKLHQVLMAILMFKSLDLAVLYAATHEPTDQFIGMLFIYALLWAGVWSIIWAVVHLFVAGKLPGMGDGA